MIAPRQASSRFLIMMFRVFFARTLPASSIPKPHCMKKTVTPAQISQKVSASAAARKSGLPSPASFARTCVRLPSSQARRSSTVAGIAMSPSTCGDAARTAVGGAIFRRHRVWW